MSEIKVTTIKPLTEFGFFERGSLAEAITAHVKHGDTQEQLLARNLGAVIQRHLTVEDSHNNLITSISQMNQGKQVSAIYAGAYNDDELDKNYLIGMASVRHDAKVRLPRGIFGNLPAFVTRRIGLLSPVIEQGSNISVWVHAEYADPEVLAPIYTELIQEMSTSVPRIWTLEAVGQPNDAYTEALKAAGMEANGIARYDEIETPGVPPLSSLYIHDLAA